MIKQQGLLLLFAALFAGAANPVSAGIIFERRDRRCRPCKQKEVLHEYRLLHNTVVE